jgi:hypothetical protein
MVIGSSFAPTSTASRWLRRLDQWIDYANSVVAE